MFDSGMVLLGEIWCWSLLGFKGLREKWLFSLQGRMWKIYTRLVLITVWIKNFYSDYNKVPVLVNFSQVWNFLKSYPDTVFFSGIRSRFSNLELVLILVGEGVFSLLICLFVRLFLYFFCVIPLWSVVFKLLHIERNYNYMLWLVITPLQTIGIKPSNFLRLSSASSF